MKKKITNKIFISVPLYFNEYHYDILKNNKDILDNFKSINKFNNGIFKYVVVYPKKLMRMKMNLKKFV